MSRRLLVLAFFALVPPAAAQTFDDVAAASGVDTILVNSASASWGDYDGDGDQDLFLGINGGSTQPNDILYQNLGNGIFVDVAAQAGVQGHTALSFQHGSAWGDYDRDGRLDLFVACSTANELFHNEGDGTFTERGAAAGIALATNPRTGVWGDLDNDGWLDLFIPNWNHPDLMYHNNGDGTFSVVPGAGGCAGGNDASASACFADYDGDGRLDVYVSRFGARNSLYRNEGNLVFTDVTSSAGLLDDHSWGAGAFGDHDNDGDLDLYVPESSAPSTDSGRHYINQGDGTFVEVGMRSGLRFEHELGLNPRGASWADHDADGDLDLYITFNRTSAGALPNRNRLFRNEGNGTFVDVAPALGVDDGSQANGITWGDHDGDGWIDLYVINEYGFPNNLFSNRGRGNHWSKLRLMGTRGPTSGIGARVRLKTGGIWQLREVSGGGTGFNCQDDLPVEFGLRDHTTIEEVEIRWPTGTVQHWYNLQVDVEHVLVEGTPIGVNYCGPAVPNSTGVPAELRAYGSTLVADGSLVLQATHVPPDKFGYFLLGSTMGFSTPPGSQGDLCIGSPIGRFLAEVRSSGPSGELHITVDLSNLPLFGAVTPGDTWHFQAWFRDLHPSSTSNLTDGVSVTFF